MAFLNRKICICVLYILLVKQFGKCQSQEDLRRKVSILENELRTVMTGIGQLCSTVKSGAKCDCKCENTYKTVKYDQIQESTPPPPPGDIRRDLYTTPSPLEEEGPYVGPIGPPHLPEIIPVSLYTTLSKGGLLHLKLTYKSYSDYTGGYCFNLYKGRPGYITHGIVRSDSRPNSLQHFSILSLLPENFNEETISLLYCVINAENSGLTIQLDGKTLMSTNNYTYSHTHSSLEVDLFDTFYVQNDKRDIVKFRVRLRNGLKQININPVPSWIDTSVSPPQFTESFGNGAVVKKITGTSDVSVQLPIEKPFIDYGGTLWIKISPNIDRKMPTSYQFPIQVVAKGKTAPFPKGLVAFVDNYRATKNTVYIFPPEGSLYCFAAGNILTDFSIYRDKEGEKVPVKADVLMLSKYEGLISYHLVHPTWEDEGKYVCEGSANRKAFRKVLQVVVRHGPAVDKSNTRVLYSGGSRDTIVVICQVTGNPLPEITFRNSSTSGPVLSPVNGFDIITVRDERKHTARGVLTIQVPESRFTRMIYCSASTEKDSETYGIKLT